MTFDEGTITRDKAGKFGEKMGGRPEVGLTEELGQSGDPVNKVLDVARSRYPDADKIRFHDIDGVLIPVRITSGPASMMDDDIRWSSLLEGDFPELDETARALDRESLHKVGANIYEVDLNRRADARDGALGAPAEDDLGLDSAQRTRLLDLYKMRARLGGARPGDSTLEYVLRKENGINIVLRRKLISAYEGDSGRRDVPLLIAENRDKISPRLFPGLSVLAADESQ